MKHRVERKILLVTGSSGFLGRETILQLVKNYRIRCLVRETSTQIIHPDIEYFVLNFSNPILKDSYFKNVFAVIHLLSVKSSIDPNIWNVNVLFTKTLINFSRRLGVVKFLYISSEVVQLPGVDNYTRSKIMAEKTVRTYENHLILRPTVIYGKSDISNIGLIVKLTKYSPIVPMIGNGQQLIQPIHISDVAKCIISGLETKVQGTHLIAGRTSITCQRLIQLISRLQNRRVITLPMPMTIVYVATYILKILKSSALQKSQVDNLKTNRSYSMTNAEELFGVTFRSPRQGLQEIFK